MDKKEDLRAKCKQKRELMQRVRTNTCSMDTLQHMAAMDPKLQMQAVQQVKSKRRTKPKEKKTKQTEEDPNISVTQSTADTEASIQSAKRDILMTAFEKEIEQVCGDANNEELKTEAQKGLTILRQMIKRPEFMAKISEQLTKWSRQRPTNEAIVAFIREIFELCKLELQEDKDKKNQHTPAFHHGPTRATKIFTE